MNDASVALRIASTPADAKQLFEWRNQPFIWQRGSSQRMVSWEEHEAWFNSSLETPERIIYIVELGGVSIGMVRFDRDSVYECVISTYLAESFVGKGWGSQAIRLACDQIATSWRINSIVALVRKTNELGKASFNKAGFISNNDLDLSGDHYVFRYLQHELSK